MLPGMIPESTKSHWRKKTQENLRKFLGHLRESPNVTRAAELIHATPSLVYRWRKEEGLTVELEDGEEVPFAEAWDDAVAVGISVLHDVGWRMATGFEEPVLHQGKLSYRTKLNKETGEYDVILDKNGEPVPLTIPKVDTGILQFYMKRYDHSFRDKEDAAATTMQSPVVVIPFLSGLSEEQVLEYISKQQRPHREPRGGED